MSDEKKEGRNYLVSALVSIPIIWLVQTYWPHLIPWQTFALWESKGTIGDWLNGAWPIFAWGCGLTLILQILGGSSRAPTWLFRRREPSAAGILGKGLLVSVWAGVVEEIAFRWLIFYGAIGTVTLSNFLIFGWLGFGVPEWLHMNIFGPVVDWTTGGYLTEYIFHPSGWMVGAAMLYA
ncbi:MAG: hypothetical protein WC824_11805, partial [Bacteroidota bacterium]